MQVSYKRNLNHNFLIFSTEEEVNTESYQIRMLAASPPDGFLKCMMQTVDNQVFFYYEITAKQNLFNMYEHKKMKHEDIQLLFGELIKTIEGMQPHLLNADCLLLNPRYVYIDAEKQQASFCFFPVESKEIQLSFRELAEYLLPKIDHTDQPAVLLGYGIYRRAMEDTMYLELIKEELYQEPGRGTIETTGQEQLWEAEQLMEVSSAEEVLMKKFLEEEKAAVHPAVSTIFITVTGLLLFGYFFFVNNSLFSWYVYVGAAVALLGVAGISAALYLLKARKNTKLKTTDESVREEELEKEEQGETSKGDTEDFNEVENYISEGETMVLVPAKTKVFPCLIGIHPPLLQPIMIKGEVLILGKLEQAVDVVLPSPAVSRIHAKIVDEDGFYLYDLNSRNGTFVNNRILASDEKYQLQDEDEIKFGDLTYCFSRFNQKMN